MEHKIVDHLFRHQYGKMVAILTRFFGLSHIETIEDAMQDTFVNATLRWRNQIPDNPEAWLTKAAKNRTIDLLRKINAENNRFDKITSGSYSIQLNELFLDHEVEDSQLRMVFVACHPSLNSKEQIAFALKTISGFSTKEIASALLLKEETIKKRLARARKTIIKNNIQFDFPPANEAKKRLTRVMEVVYLTFNEGFHSTNEKQLIHKELCGEALRLCRLLLTKEKFRSGSLYALFALMCFHSARLESKINASGEIVDLKHQDRTKWHEPLIVVGNNAMNKAMEFEDISIYHYEASIAAEHLKAASFQDTNWSKMLLWYEQMEQIQPSAFSELNKAIVNIQMKKYDSAKQLLDKISIDQLEQRAYLFHGTMADYYDKIGEQNKAIHSLESAITEASNNLEMNYMTKKKELLLKNKVH